MNPRQRANLGSAMENINLLKLWLKDLPDLPTKTTIIEYTEKINESLNFITRQQMIDDGNNK
jgi:hypothetical protein